VRLALGDPTFRVRDAGGDRVRGPIEEGAAPAQERVRARPTGRHQGRPRDPRQAGGGRAVVPHAGRVVGQGVRDRLQAGPRRRAPSALDHLVGGADRPHEQLEGVTATALAEQRLQLRDVVPLPLRRTVGHVVRHLVDGEPVDRDPRRGLQRQRAAGGHAVQVRPSAGLDDQRAEVLELALQGVGQGVIAVAPVRAV
jgi:hypothetical protein